MQLIQITDAYFIWTVNTECKLDNICQTATSSMAISLHQLHRKNRAHLQQAAFWEVSDKRMTINQQGFYVVIVVICF